MILNAEDYRRRAQTLEQLARDTPDPVVRKSLYSVAANWRALADQAAGQAGRPRLFSSRYDGLPGQSVTTAPAKPDPIARQ